MKSPPPERQSRTTYHDHRILIIDDNPAIHDDFRKVLLRSPAEHHELDTARNLLFGDTVPDRHEPRFELDSAFQGQDGLVLVQRALAENDPYAVAFVDFRMPPGWDGVKTIDLLWQHSPELQVVACTAYSDYSWEEIIVALGWSDRLLILKKPFDSVEVLQMAHALARKWTLTQESKCRMHELDSKVIERTKALQLANERLSSEFAERQRLESQLRQAQKMEAIGQLAGGIAHDFNNLLSVIRANAEAAMIGQNLGARHMGDCIGHIVAACDRASGLTRQLLAFGRRQVLNPEDLDLNAVVGNTQQMLARIIGKEIQLKGRYAADLPKVKADIGMIEQVLVNLVVNARDAMPHGGQLTLATDSVRLEDEDVLKNPQARSGEFVRIRVSDTGVGIAPEHLPRIFEPFFTTKEAGKGTGLGLAVIYGIVKQHHGWVEVSSQIGVGTTFEVFLPLKNDLG